MVASSAPLAVDLRGFAFCVVPDPASAEEKIWRAMPITRRTRYGGAYDGGRWGTFGVADWIEVPAGAFGGDVAAVDWWWRGPSVAVVGGR